MARLALTGGAYQARSVIASAQRSLNLYPEPMPQQQGEPSQFAFYPTPGLTLAGTLPQGPIRGIKQATNDQIYVAAGSGIYVLTSWTPFAATLLGSITAGRSTPVVMQDNSETLVIVDGSTNGWQVDLASNGFSAISDPTGMFVGADRVSYLDGYLLFNKPGTPQFYSSNNLAVTFDPLYFANKSSYPDNLVVLAVAKREIWLFGERTTEVWYNAGSPDFPFSQIPSTFVDHGCIAKYSVAGYDNSMFWLTLNRQGGPLVMQGAGYQTKRVSTYALEALWTTYTVTDATAFIYQLGGHVIYVLTFPTNDHTWCYDISTQEWHEWSWVDNNGVEHRSRCGGAYPMTWGGVLAGDWQNANLYWLDPANLTDNGQPIKRQRSWQHLLNDGKRVFHRQFAADFETGMDGTPPPSTPQQLICCLFNGPDGTPVEQYSFGATEANASWSLWGGAGAVLESGGAIAVNGTTTYVSLAPAPPIADYSVAFRVLPNAPVEVNGSSARVAVRTTDNTVATGYWAGCQILNDIWVAVLGNVDVALGLPPRGGWFDLLLTAVGATISLTVQRSSDGMFLMPNAGWQSTAAPAITLTSTAFATAGRIMFGLNSIPTGVMGTEDTTGTWVLEDNSGFSWEWDEVPTDSLRLDNIVATTIPTPWQLYLDWSDDRGHTYGNPVGQSMGAQGEYLTQVQFQRLGMCRDRVYRLTWTSPVRTALQGAWIEAQPALS